MISSFHQGINIANWPMPFSRRARVHNTMNQQTDRQTNLNTYKKTPIQESQHSIYEPQPELASYSILVISYRIIAPISFLFVDFEISIVRST